MAVFLDLRGQRAAAAGRVLGVNVVVMEITQRKKIENELERLLLQEKAAREEAEAAKPREHVLAELGARPGVGPRVAMDHLTGGARGPRRSVRELVDAQRVHIERLEKRMIPR